MISKSRQLKLLFPYDWSNPSIPDDALILNVLGRCLFEDVCRIVLHYGAVHVESLWRTLPPDHYRDLSLRRMLSNIQWAIDHGH